ncbi:hypothetical protein ACFYT3_18530 [Nocardia amikacinitolerans]|uniref:hypothetical protein n=1 Tax=Nocardia amikacinitolerans TaxID=756689 RepID=UPI0020A533F7|nr:hypothetical protein [Nocardia amikacinitolerans]MCP2289095.1 hypothetical protein [Nocardia amikacinitolerans]
MWEWGRTVAEYATAAATNWRVREAEPTILDPEFEEEESTSDTTARGEREPGSMAGYDLVG